MADSLGMLKRKMRFAVQNYLTASGVMHVDEEPSYIAKEFGKALNLTDPEQIQTIRHRVDRANACLTVDGNQSNGWCNEDEAVETFCWHMLKNPQRCIKKWVAYFEYFFELFDQDQDGYINAEQFAIHYTSFYRASKKREDKEFIARAFKAIDKENTGKLSKKQYVEAYVAYLADPDVPYEDLPLF